MGRKLLHTGILFRPTTSRMVFEYFDKIGLSLPREDETQTTRELNAARAIGFQTVTVPTLLGIGSNESASVLRQIW